ncbi:MAG: hypothetical protein NTW28_22105 [Candidatus Solibacter sp.]|nr:hypothetical protein [Candidatus Solibacter sp.]
MNRNARMFCFLVFTLAVWSGCSGKPSADEAKKAAVTLDRIQGKAQVLVESGGASEGTRRYRLFFKRPYEVTHGDHYIVEGINAQRVIDEIGDPEQGKGGYPLLSSCARVVKMVWSLPFDAIDLNAQVLRTRVNRYPARPVFLVARIQAAKSSESGAISGAEKKDDTAKGKNAPEVPVAAEKQRALLIEGPPVQTAPLWDPKGGTVNCRVIIGPDGKIAELDTGKQLCEIVPWSQYRYQPPVQGGHPVKVSTEVEVRFEPRK